MNFGKKKFKRESQRDIENKLLIVVTSGEG